MITGTSARREELLDAAAACFARGGFHATTVTDISVEAGCSQGLLYRYFPGKQALIGALVERETAATVAALDAAARAADPLPALRALAARSLDEALQQGALELEMAAEATRDEVVARALRQGLDAIVAALAGALRAGQSTGVFDPALDPKPTARWLVAMVDGLCSQRAMDPGLDITALLTVLEQLLAKVLQPEHPTRKVTP